MSQPPTKSSLSRAQRWILERMQWLNYGRIEELSFHEGEPLFEPPPRFILRIKTNGCNGARPELDSEDFPLKAEQRNFFQYLGELESGIVRKIEICAGLPVSMEVEKTDLLFEF